MKIYCLHLVFIISILLNLCITADKENQLKKGEYSSPIYLTEKVNQFTIDTSKVNEKQMKVEIFLSHPDSFDIKFETIEEEENKEEEEEKKGKEEEQEKEEKSKEEEDEKKDKEDEKEEKEEKGREEEKEEKEEKGREEEKEEKEEKGREEEKEEKEEKGKEEEKEEKGKEEEEANIDTEEEKQDIEEENMNKEDNETEYNNTKYENETKNEEEEEKEEEDKNHKEHKDKNETKEEKEEEEEEEEKNHKHHHDKNETKKEEEEEETEHNNTKYENETKKEEEKEEEEEKNHKHHKDKNETKKEEEDEIEHNNTQPENETKKEEEEKEEEEEKKHRHHKDKNETKKEEEDETEHNNTKPENETKNEEEKEEEEKKKHKHHDKKILNYQEYYLRNLKNVDFEDRGFIGGKKTYIFDLKKEIENIQIKIEKKDNKKLEKPFCIIKYQFNDEFEKEINEFNSDLEASKTNNSNIELSFEKIKDNKNIKNIYYTAYICDKNINLEYIHPKYLEENKCTNVEIKDSDEKKINLNYKLKDDQDYTIVVLATVEYNNKIKEDFIYKAQKFINKKIINNDLKFYIIMGSFAFVIILVFIIVFRIIYKRKANNPDIDDEEYSNLQVLRDTINEDET